MPGFAAVVTARRAAGKGVGVAAGKGIDVQNAAVREREFVGAFFEIFRSDFFAVPTTGEHALAILAVGEDVAIDLEPHGLVLGRGVGVDVEQQLGALKSGRRDIEFDFGQRGGGELFADVAIDTHFVG